MVFAVDIRDHVVRVWTRDGENVRFDRDSEYTPTVYISARKPQQLEWLHPRIEKDPKVNRASIVKRRTSLQEREPTNVLRADLECPSEIQAFAEEIRGAHEPEKWMPGTFRLYNVDLAPKFRYCLETSTDPTPTEQLRTLSLSIPERALAHDDLVELRCEGDRIGDSEANVLNALGERLEATDPDVLVLSNGDLIPLIENRAEELGQDVHLGRLPEYTQLSTESTYQSYGQIGFSPARYDIPGRAIIDRSNSFLWNDGGLPGLLDLVERSRKPLQETAWGLIGNIFTSIQIREALGRNVLVPWKAWEGEQWKSLDTLHQADQGGFIFQPDVGFHENVTEIDFASLYPNIMRVNNLSPETVRCDCHDRQDVPEIGYSVCDRDGFLPGVLRPLIEDRSEIKRQIAETDDPRKRDRLEGRSEALKWVLVTCFGYQGFNNSKFGRIEVHESINAYARELMLDAKEVLEDGGWRIVHGIIDSLWVTPAPDREQTPISELTTRISQEQGIALEHEGDFDWAAFLPRRDSQAGALTKYFGKKAESQDYKIRGIEARQRSMPPWIEDVQRNLIETLDEHRAPEVVCGRLSSHLHEIRSKTIDVESLVFTARCSMPLEQYQQRTRNVAALERYRDHGIERSPGQDVHFVVVDDSKTSKDRVRLPWEADDYDAEFYESVALRAAESVLLPFGWDDQDIEAYLADSTDSELSLYV